MTSRQKRLAWIVGLAAGGAAIVGGIAYASTKSSSGTTKPSTSPLPSGPFKQGHNIFTTPPPPPGSQSITAVAGGTGTVKAQPGTLVINVPATWFYAKAAVSETIGPPQYNPPGNDLANGGTITIALNAMPGTITVSGTSIESSPISFTITVQ